MAGSLMGEDPEEGRPVRFRIGADVASQSLRHDCRLLLDNDMGRHMTAAPRQPVVTPRGPSTSPEFFCF